MTSARGLQSGSNCTQTEVHGGIGGCVSCLFFYCKNKFPDDNKARNECFFDGVSAARAVMHTLLSEFNSSALTFAIDRRRLVASKNEEGGPLLRVRFG